MHLGEFIMFLSWGDSFRSKGWLHDQCMWKSIVVLEGQYGETEYWLVHKDGYYELLSEFGVLAELQDWEVL